MSKYSGLGDYLRTQGSREVPMTFADVERVTGTKLPPKAQDYPAWWSNNPSNNVMTQIWLDAGFKSERVNIASRKLVFVRSHTEASERTPAKLRQGGSARHPLLGALKGLAEVMPNVDLTAPVDPAWGEPS